MINQHKDDKIIKEEDGIKITDKSQIIIYLNHILVIDNTIFLDINIKVKLANKFEKFFKFKKREDQKYYFNENLEM